MKSLRRHQERRMCVLLIFKNWFYLILCIDTAGCSLDHKPLAQSYSACQRFLHSCSSRVKATTWRTLVGIGIAASLPTTEGWHEENQKDRNSRFDNLVETNIGNDDMAVQRQIEKEGE